MSKQNIEINTYLFINIGVTGLYDRDNNLSEVKLVVLPVTRQELQTKTARLNECVLFDFLPVETHSAGQCLKDYKLKFSIEEYERLTTYIQSFAKPVALVAYNGFTFAFPILQEAIKGFCGLQSDLRCTDLMQGIFELENEYEPQNPRDDGKMPWEFKKDKIFRDYQFSKMFLRTIGYDCGVDEKIQNRTKSDNDEGLPLPKLRAIVQWAMLYPQIWTWLNLETSYVTFNNLTVT